MSRPVDIGASRYQLNATVKCINGCAPMAVVVMSPVTLPNVRGFWKSTAVLGGLKAPRSLLAVENLADAILFALSPACPARQSYTVADPEPISVAEMLAAMRAGLGRGAGLLPVPEAWLRLVARLAGREETFFKLAGSLVARPERLLRAGWRPPAETQAALARLAASARAG